MISADRFAEFVAIVDEGSISAAARTLSLPRATLSRRISTLEDALGVLLLHRSTRRLVPTPAGLELHRRAGRVVADTQNAWAAVQRLDDVPRGPLRVSVADSRAAASDLFVQFALDFPEVRLEVDVTSRHVDLVAEGVDVAVRFGSVDDQSLIVRKLWTSHYIAVASPEYIDAKGLPETALDLKTANCIAGFAGKATPTRKWPLREGGEIPIGVQFASGDIELRIQAVLKGIGIALLPEQTVRNHIMQGRLHPVLPDTVGTESLASLVFVDREFTTPQVRAFIDRAVSFYRGCGSGSF